MLKILFGAVGGLLVGVGASNTYKNVMVACAMTLLTIYMLFMGFNTYV